jgi:hypothetical protein
LPPDQCLPEVWLTHDHEEASAKELLHSVAEHAAAALAVRL